MNNIIEKPTNQIFSNAGLFALSLRMVVGWTYFSAFWRRLILTNKLDPEIPGYIGEKFNHFLPNALGIKPMIEFMVSNPEWLWWSMVSFTIVEAIVGLFIIFGLFTRLMSIGVFGLAMGILLGAGWIGTTCLDEWQIGVLGLATGFTLFFTGGGSFSLDGWLARKHPDITSTKWFNWIGSGSIPVNERLMRNIVVGGSFLILIITLSTNQIFHGGVWGKLHNKSVKPKIEISDAQLSTSQLSFEISRVEGADVYGSFLIGVSLLDNNGSTVINLNGNDLSLLPESDIRNNYVAKIEPGKHSLVIPLGAKATITINDNNLNNLKTGIYELVLTDISGITWSETITL